MARVQFKSFSKERLEHVVQFLKSEGIAFIIRNDGGSAEYYVIAVMDADKARKVAMSAEVGLDM